MVVWGFIYLALMARALYGYLLPWGKCHFGAAQVIINPF
ncbi:MAG: hypothetical protein CM15mP93_01150 [Thiotrichaceae bacterium]|nr:MAG: hypothetical protein CM15mP93_01150 [Thiotrichaceae bacterium]